MPTLELQKPTGKARVRVVTVADVRAAALLLWGHRADAERFLNRPHQLLDGHAPLAVAQQSPAGAAQVKTLIDAARAGVAV